MKNLGELLAAICFLLALSASTSAGDDRPISAASLAPLGAVNSEKRMVKGREPVVVEQARVKDGARGTGLGPAGRSTEVNGARSRQTLVRR